MERPLDITNLSHACGTGYHGKRRALVAGLMGLLLIADIPHALASTKTSAIVNGSSTIIAITWTNDGLDGGRPVEHTLRCDQVGGVPEVLLFYFGGQNIKSTPELHLYSAHPPWQFGCDGRGVFSGVTHYFGNPFTVVIPGDQRGKTLCYGTWSNNGYAGQFPGQTCTTVADGTPPPPVECDIGTVEQTLAHGDLASSSLDGNTVTRKVGVYCIGAGATVHLRAVRSGSQQISTIPLRGDSSVTSRLTLNGVDGATGVSVVVPANTQVKVDLTSTLHGSGAAAGALEGDAILILTVP